MNASAYEPPSMNRAAIIGDLLRRASLTPPDLLAADVANALHDAGGNHLVLYVVDYEQETLQPVALASDLLDERPKGVTIEGTMAGRSFQSQQVLSAETDEGWRVWAPVRERAERIGVLELGFPPSTERRTSCWLWPTTSACWSATSPTPPAATPTSSSCAAAGGR